MTPRKGRYTAIGAVLVAGLLAGAAVMVILAVRGPSGGADYEVVIQPGTAALAESGFDADFFPEGFTMRVGQTLVIRNRDNQVATMGPFVVAPGETLTKQFTEPGTVEGYCSFTGGARAFFTVLPA
jgi:hypothetical protein